MNEPPKCQSDLCTNPVKKDKAYPKTWTKFCSRSCANTYSRNSSRDKIRQTCIEKYGAPSFISSAEGVELIRKKSLEKYGVDNPSKDIKKKLSLEKYGVDNPSKSDNVKEKIHRNRNPYRSYDYRLPSGKSLRLQGYEGIFLDMYLEHSSENTIVSGKEVPSFSYVFEGVERKYYPDFYVPELNLIIEVKSTWTYKAQKEKNEEKKKAVISNGFDYFMVAYDATNRLVMQCGPEPNRAFQLRDSSSPEDA